MNPLLHPEYFTHVPIFSKALTCRFASLANNAQPSAQELAGITVGIRTLNEAPKLEQLLIDITRQEFNGPIEIIIIDNESSDNTKDIAKKFGATLITLPRAEFTYPKSMNMAMEAASHELVFLTVGHAQLISTKVFRAGVAAFQSDSRVTGAFGHALPGVNASRTENIIAIGNLRFAKKRLVTKSTLGTLAATGCIIKKSVWGSLGKFDERFEVGGEDGQLARAMLEQGYILVDEPLLSVHHTHGLGFVNTVKQWRGWFQSAKPMKLDTAKLQKRRPDLDVKS